MRFQTERLLIRIAINEVRSERQRLFVGGASNKKLRSGTTNTVRLILKFLKELKAIEFRRHSVLFTRQYI